MTTKDHTKSSQSAYEGPTPPAWDIGRPQKAVAALVRQGLESPVLDLGCGTGENTLMMVEHGLEVVAIDPSPLAVAMADDKAKKRGVDFKFREGNGLKLDALDQTFNTIIDAGVFHVFDDSERETYVANLHRALNVGGHYYGICFSDREPEGWGPRRVTAEEVHSAFSEGWELVSLEPSVYETLKVSAVKAWLITAKRL